MALSKRHWPDCHTTNFKAHPPYTVNPGEPRPLYHGQQCNAYFSEPKNTPLEGLKTPLSQISLVLEAINEGMGLTAERDTALFEQAMTPLARVVEQTADLTLLTDGKRRSGNLLFELGQAVLRTGQVGRPKKRSSPV